MFCNSQSHEEKNSDSDTVSGILESGASKYSVSDSLSISIPENPAEPPKLNSMHAEVRQTKEKFKQ